MLTTIIFGIIYLDINGSVGDIMLIEKNELWENNNKVTLTSYLLDYTDEIGIQKRPSIIICPGGGYLFASDREAEPIAMKFAGEGYNTFVLRYNVYNEEGQNSNNTSKVNKETKYPNPLFDLAKAMLVVRKNAEKWSVDKDKIFVCGFSAGGHLAASLGVHWQDRLLREKFNVDNEIFKPNGLILGYPVLDYLTMMEVVNEKDDEWLIDFWKTSNNALFGEKNPSVNYLGELSPVKFVTDKTPPTFLWHTASDGLVTARNSLNFAAELSKKGVPYELHIFEKGDHGLALCDKVTAKYDCQINLEVKPWFDMALTWLKKYSF
ncbi:alpha/beta hydrolase [Clostridium sp. HBUAS56017]|uniref:alpha/beta hydrolase n=1 Tax=Clostridium sp. HBUAS56017 TaxID=2571128 RepID=UPI001FA9513F|nr:alpha/beta hydrolase [Clostridium sp. HBUAS56017]